MRVSGDRSPDAGPTTTESIVVGEENVESLSIIVWCVGGILLVTLLALLSRIILAKKKDFSDEYETLGSTLSRSNTFRIYIDPSGRLLFPGSARRETRASVANPDMAFTPNVQTSPGTVGNVASRNTEHSAQTSATEMPTTDLGSEILTRQLRVGEYINSLPQRAQRAEVLTVDSSGSSATINGVVISPPSYSDVVNSTTRIPSVVIGRENRSQPNQFFSL